MTQPVSEMTPEERRAYTRASVAKHKAMMDEMTRLEQAAFKERKILGSDKSPYTPEELEEAEAIRALAAEIQARADRLHRQLMQRLERGAGTDAGNQALLTRFSSMAGTRVELAPF